MKVLKIYVVALVAVVGVLFGSCMSSNDSGSYDGAAFVTVNDDYWMGGVTLTTDGDNLTLIPSNPSALKYKAGPNVGQYPKRAYVYFKLPDGVKFTSGVKEYNVTLLEDLVMDIPVSGLNQRPDTLNNYPIIDYLAWTSQGYLTTLTNVYYNSSPLDVQLYIDTNNIPAPGENRDNLLPMVLKYTTGGNESGSGSYTTNLATSWRLTDISPWELEEMGLNLSDSVLIQVTAGKQAESSTPKVFKLKYKFNN